MSVASKGGRLYTGLMAGRKHTPLRSAAVGALCALLAAGPVRAAEPKAVSPATAPPKAAARATGKGKGTTDARWLQKSKATLELRSKTGGATVLLDGKEVGLTPLPPLKVDPGTHQLTLTKQGLADGTLTLQFKPGKKLKVALDLRPPEPEDAVSASPAPPLLVAEVVKAEANEKKGSAADLPPDDGPPLITAAGDLAGATPGPVKAEAVAVKQLAATGPPPAAAPAEAVRSAPLPSGERPLAQRWWFWSGLAAAAVVLVAGVVYALPPQYVEKRDPAAACGGAACGVIVNK